MLKCLTCESPATRRRLRSWGRLCRRGPTARHTTWRTGGGGHYFSNCNTRRGTAVISPLPAVPITTIIRRCRSSMRRFQSVYLAAQFAYLSMHLPVRWSHRFRACFNMQLSPYLLALNRKQQAAVTAPGGLQSLIQPSHGDPCRIIAELNRNPSTRSGTNRERIGNESERSCGTEILDSRPIVSHSGFPAGCEEFPAAAA